MKPRFSPRLIFWGGAAVLLAAAAFLSFLIQKRQDELSRASTYDLSWTAGQTVVEVARLGQAIAAYTVSPQLVPRREVELRLELFLSRAELTNGSFFRDLSASDPACAHAVEQLRLAAEALPALVDNLDDKQSAQAAIRMIVALTPELSRVASAANLKGGTHAYEAQRSLLHWHWIFSALTFSLIFAGLVLLVSMERQNRIMQRTRQAAEDAQAQAEISSQAKTDFLAAMSHEIRTPLNGIMGFTDLILDRADLDAIVRRQVEVIKTSGAALLTVVNDVLDFSKIEADAVELEQQPFSPAATLANSLSIVHGLAERKGLRLTSEIAADIPRLILGDEARVQQVLLNLLNNAIKFTPAGDVRAMLSLESTAEAPLLRFSIVDTGIGIPAEKKDRLFQRFSQVDSSASRQFGGTGLGLAISKRLIDLMGGRIGVSSEPGQGSTFWFSLTARSADQAALERTGAQPGSSVPARHGTILVAEDVEINQEIIRAVLEAAGHRVDLVQNGAEAISAVQNGWYDLVLMDIQMPIMDGVEATRQIRSQGGPARDVPILALTANVYAEQVAMFREAGMNDHIGKPIHRQKLLDVVHHWLRSRAVNESHDLATSVQQPVFDRRVYDELAELMGEAGIARLLSKLEDQLRAWTGSRFHQQDRQQVASQAHKIVSSAGMLGFTRLSALSSSLEQACLSEAWLSNEEFDALLTKVRGAREEVLNELSEFFQAA